MTDGAVLVYEYIDSDGTGYGNTITIFSANEIVEAARGIYLGDQDPPPDPLWAPQEYWEPTLPIVDLTMATTLPLTLP